MIDDCNKCAAQLCTDDRKRIFQQLYVLCKNGSWVGDVIMAAAGDLKRTIKVYSASINSSPLMYDPHGVTARGSAFSMAFFEPGHNKAALPSLSSSSSCTPHGVQTSANYGAVQPPFTARSTSASLSLGIIKKIAVCDPISNDKSDNDGGNCCTGYTRFIIALHV